MARWVGVLAAVAVPILLLYSKFLDGYLWDDDFTLIASGWTFDPTASFGIFNRSHFYRPLIDLYFDLAMAVSLLAFPDLSLALAEIFS